MTKVFRSGFVAIIGRPNVGKSTLLNRLVGEKVAIVSPRPQTTRSKVLGILNQEDAQVIFVDTPGLHKPRTKLGSYMEKTVHDAMQGIELLLLMVDAGSFGKADLEIAAGLKDMKTPKYLVINKTDSVHPQSLLPLMASFSEMQFDLLLPISARTGEGVDTLMDRIVSVLPEGPRYYPEDIWTDQTERQMVAEIIREKALMNLKEEVPHGIGVEVLSMTDVSDHLTEIHANVFCERDNHKGIIIGRKGAMLQTIGSQARGTIELLLGRQVNLQLWVKVREGWRNNAGDLDTLGYSER